MTSYDAGVPINDLGIGYTLLGYTRFYYYLGIMIITYLLAILPEDQA